MKQTILAGCLLLVGIWAPGAFAESPFEISIQVFGHGGYEGPVYYRPPQNIIRVKGTEYATPLKVVVKNVSSGTQRLDIDTADNGLGQIVFEVTDEKDNKNVITKKVDYGKSQSRAYVMVGPGNAREFEIRLNPDEWENAFKFVKEGASRLRARAVYKNGSQEICSDYYTIILEE